MEMKQKKEQRSLRLRGTFMRNEGNEMFISRGQYIFKCYAFSSFLTALEISMSILGNR